MITATCTGCGDAHLCPGIPAPPVSQNLLDTLSTFIEATFLRDPVGYVSSSGAYVAYLDWCTRNSLIPMSQRKFIPVMGVLGYPRVKRSTMRLAGLAWRDSAYRRAQRDPAPVHHSPWFTPQRGSQDVSAVPGGPNRGPFRDAPTLRPAVPGAAGSSPTQP